MKITKEETGRNPSCSAAPTDDSQVRQLWSGTPAVLQQRGWLEAKPETERNSFNTKRKDIHSEIPYESHHLQRPKADKSKKTGRNQHKKDEVTKNQNASPPPRDHNSSPAREQNWMENEFDTLTEAGFRR